MSDDPLYKGGFPNPDRLGFIPLRQSSGDEPDAKEIERAAGILGRPVRETDAEGYECEIVGAAVGGGAGSIAYVASRAKKQGQYVDIEFRLHLRAPGGTHNSWDVQTYNPYFGCDVRFFQWIGRHAILIYREKHRTYVCKVKAAAEPVFVKIEDDWIINGRTLAYWGWEATQVSRLTLPDLTALDAVSEEEAKAQRLLPSKYW